MGTYTLIPGLHPPSTFGPRGAGAWEFAKLGISQEIPILAIQEVGLKEHELQALCKFLNKTGYRAYEAPAVLRSGTGEASFSWSIKTLLSAYLEP